MASLMHALDDAALRHCTPSGAGSVVWRSWGAGPPLVLLHGGFGSWRHWIRAIPTLAQNFLVIAPDLPGMGESDHPAPDTPSLECLVDVLACGLAQILGPTRRYHLAGFSFGGMVAGALAVQERDIVRSLVLVAPVGLAAGRPRPTPVRFRHLSGAERLAAHRTNLVTMMLSHERHADELAVHIQELNNAATQVTRFEVARSDGLRAALPYIHPAPLVIWGELDNLSLGFIGENTAIVRAARPNAEVEIVPGAGHWLPYEAPGLVVAAIVRQALRVSRAC